MSRLTPVFLARVDDGKLVFEQPPRVRQHIRSLEGKLVQVVIKQLRHQRTLRANRFYFGVIVSLMAEEFGYEKQEMHEVLAMRFLRIEDCPITGSPRRKPTPECETKEFAEYTDACIRLAAEHGIVVPSPDEVEL